MRGTETVAAAVRPRISYGGKLIGAPRMLLLSFLLPPAIALDEMHTYGVEAFGADPECCDSCGVIPWSIDASDKVFDDFSDFIDDSDWDVARSNNNAAVEPEDWIDDDEDPSFGDDNVDPWGGR